MIFRASRIKFQIYKIMATSRPFAYNTGSPIPGTSQYGDIAVGGTAQGYNSGVGSVRWWNGPDEDLGWVIAKTNPAGNQPNPDGVASSMAFQRTVGFDDNQFIVMSEKLSGYTQTFADANAAKTWLLANGYWTSYTQGASLIMSLDSTLGISGSTWADQTAFNNDGTLYGGYGTTTFNGNQVVTLNGSDAYVFPTAGFGTELDTGLTYEVWAYPLKTTNGTLITEWQGAPPTGWYDAQMAFVGGRINVGVYPDNFTPDPYLQGPAFSANNWYNIVMTYDNVSGDLKLYRNGTLVGTTNGTKANPPATFLTLGLPDQGGGYLGGATNYFEGYIGLWRIWNGAISNAQVLSNYNTYKSRYGL